MANIHCDCPIDQMDKWWPSLESAGVEVVRFEEAERAIEIAKRVMGEEMWSDKMVREERGGLACVDGVWMFVLIQGGKASPSGNVRLCCGVVKRPRLFEFASQQEREALRKLMAVLAECDIITRQTWMMRLGKWMFGGSC